MKAKKMMVLMLLQLSALGLATSLSVRADTLSDLQAQCLSCHNYIVSPSGWSLNGSTLGRHPAEQTLNWWLITISSMGDGMCGFNNIGPGGTPRSVAAQFLYDKQYITVTPTPTPIPVSLTSIAVAPVNHTINAGASQQFTSNGIFSDGTSRTLTDGDGMWVAKTAMPAWRAYHSVGVVNGKLYALGGYTNLGTLATMDAYDPATNSWTPKASMSTQRAGAAVGVVNGTLYAVGGYYTTSTYAIPLATMEAYDPVTDTWTPKASMSTPRSGAAVGVVNGKLYAVGGSDGVNLLATVEAYDPATNTWMPKASLSTPHYGHAVGVINGTLYTVGGHSTSNLLETVEAYDPATDTWTPRASLPTVRHGLAAGVMNGILYAVGGTNYTSALATVEAYDPATNTWASRAPLPTPRVDHAAGVINDTLYAVGDYYDSNGTLTTAYTPPEVTWSSSNSSVAKIASSGLALGISEGSTAITATSGGVSGSTSLMVLGQLDITITAISSSAAAVERGKTFTFNSTTKNQGTVAINATSTGLYLSTDATITTADTLVGSVSVGSLAAGTSQSASASITLSKKLARGTYYLGAIADYTNAEIESNESNNSFTGTTIQVK